MILWGAVLWVSLVEWFPLNSEFLLIYTSIFFFNFLGSIIAYSGWANKLVKWILSVWQNGGWTVEQTYEYDINKYFKLMLKNERDCSITRG